MFKDKNDGVTLLRLLLVIGIAVVLVALLIVGLDPPRYFAQVRNTDRWSDVSAILNAIERRTVDNGGIFGAGCDAGAVPGEVTRIASSTYDVAPCLVPDYISEMPFDPGDPDAYYNSAGDYDLGYEIQRIGGKVTVSAPSAELEEGVSLTRQVF